MYCYHALSIINTCMFYFVLCILTYLIKTFWNKFKIFYMRGATYSLSRRITDFGKKISTSISEPIYESNLI